LDESVTLDERVTSDESVTSNESVKTFNQMQIWEYFVWHTLIFTLSSKVFCSKGRAFQSLTLSQLSCKKLKNVALSKRHILHRICPFWNRVLFYEPASAVQKFIFIAGK
jgi:hypothetical protein